jgi:hypothetical protein
MDDAVYAPARPDCDASPLHPICRDAQPDRSRSSAAGRRTSGSPLVYLYHSSRWDGDADSGLVRRGRNAEMVLAPRARDLSHSLIVSDHREKQPQISRLPRSLCVGSLESQREIVSRELVVPKLLAKNGKGEKADSSTHHPQTEQRLEPRSLRMTESFWGRWLRDAISVCFDATGFDGGVEALADSGRHLVDLVAAIDLDGFAGGVEDDFAVAALAQVSFDFGSGLGCDRFVDHVVEDREKLSASHLVSSVWPARLPGPVFA